MENKKIRRRILEILYAKDEENPGDSIERKFLKKELGVSDNKLDSNISYLIEKGYIESGTLSSVRITSDGKDLVENKEEFNSMFPVTINQNIIYKSPGTVIAEKSKTGDISSPKIINSPGSNIKIDMGEQTQFNISTDNGWEKFILWFGRKILSLNKIQKCTAFGIPSLISIYILLDTLLKIYLPQITIVIPMFWFGIMILLFSAYKSRTCEKCGKRFAYEEFKPPKVVATGEYKGSKIYNVKKFFKCHFCGYETEREVVDEY